MQDFIAQSSSAQAGSGRFPSTVCGRSQHSCCIRQRHAVRSIPCKMNTRRQDRDATSQPIAIDNSKLYSGTAFTTLQANDFACAVNAIARENRLPNIA